MAETVELPPGTGEPSLPGSVDSLRFTEAHLAVEGHACTDCFERLDDELAGPPGMVRWRFRGSRSRRADGSIQQWLDLTAALDAHRICARCDEPAPVSAQIVRRYLLVDSESEAELLDRDAEEFDVLVSDRNFSLDDLLEDECLMSLPGFVVHETCAPGTSEPPQRRNPFAALASLKQHK